MSFPNHRPRRLRTTPAMRRLTAETRLAPADLILPAFIREGLTEPSPISSMPGVVQHTTESLKRAAAEAVELGVGGIMLFGVPAVRDAQGTASLDPEGVLNKATFASTNSRTTATAASLIPMAMWTTTPRWRSMAGWQSPRPTPEPTSWAPRE